MTEEELELTACGHLAAIIGDPTAGATNKITLSLCAEDHDELRELEDREQQLAKHFSKAFLATRAATRYRDAHKETHPTLSAKFGTIAEKFSLVCADMIIEINRAEAEIYDKMFDCFYDSEFSIERKANV